MIAQPPAKIQAKTLEHAMKKRRKTVLGLSDNSQLFGGAAVIETFDAKKEIDISARTKCVTVTWICLSEIARQVALGLRNITNDNLPGKLTVEPLMSDFYPAGKMFSLVDEYLIDEEEIWLAGSSILSHKSERSNKR